MELLFLAHPSPLNELVPDLLIWSQFPFFDAPIMYTKGSSVPRVAYLATNIAYHLY